MQKSDFFLKKERLRVKKNDKNTIFIVEKIDTRLLVMCFYTSFAMYIYNKVKTMKRIIAFLILSIALMLAGCKSPSKFVTETTNHSTKIERSDSLKKVKERQEKDSIHIKDSTIINFTDSIKIIERWHTQFKYRNILTHDTIYQKGYLLKTDTLYINKVKEVVKYKTPSEALWVIVVLVIFCIILVFVKFKN